MKVVATVQETVYTAFTTLMYHIPSCQTFDLKTDKKKSISQMKRKKINEIRENRWCQKMVQQQLKKWNKSKRWGREGGGVISQCIISDWLAEKWLHFYLGCHLRFITV